MLSDGELESVVALGPALDFGEDRRAVEQRLDEPDQARPDLDAEPD